MRRTALVISAFVGMAHAATALAAPCGTENLLAGKKPHASSETKGDVALLTDGNVAPEGAQWDAPVVVTLTSPAATVTYDLGEPRQISALSMQGDANDVYRVAASLDGSPTSFAPLTEFPNVVNIGHGLRTRNVEIAPATVRYLRVGEAAGDGFFTISELAAYCEKPSSFATKLRTVDVPPQYAGEAPKRGMQRFQTVYVAALLALAALAYRTFKRRRNGGGDAGS